MKSVIRSILINSLSLWLTSIIFKGLVISDTLQTVLFAGVVLFVINMTLKPILNFIALPFNLFTLGLASWLVNVIILYLLTVLLPTIKIVNFMFEGADILGVVLPSYNFTAVTGLIAASLLISVISAGVKWLR